MKIPLGTGTPPAASLRNAARGGAGRARITQQKPIPCWMLLLLLWPHCWEHPAGQLGCRQRPPAQGRLSLGWQPWVGARWASAAPSPRWPHGASRGSVWSAQSHHSHEDGPILVLMLVPPTSQWGREQGQGGQVRGQGRWDNSKWEGGHQHWVSVTQLSSAVSPPPAHGTNQRQNMTPGPQPSQPCCPQAQTQL